jgi:hypothetical protein
MFKKLSREAWIKFATSLEYGDVLFVSDTGILGQAIQWGTDNGDSICVCHVFSYEGLGIGQTREADGKKMTAKHVINEYMDRCLKGKARLIVYRAIGGLTADEKNRIKSFWDLHEKEDYNMLENVGFGIWALLNKINRSFGSWVAKTFTNPFYNGKNMVCSQTAILQFKGGDNRLYDPVMNGIAMDKLTPEELLVRIPKAFYNVLDTEKMA